MCRSSLQIHNFISLNFFFSFFFFQCGLMRDVGIIDVYRHVEGAPLKGAFPVVVQFKARREKEQIMWRAKEKLRNTDIVVTEDSHQRLVEIMNKEKEKLKKAGLRSPSKAAPASPSKGIPTFTAPPARAGKPRSLMQFQYSSVPPTHKMKNSATGSPTKSPTKSPNKNKLLTSPKSQGSSLSGNTKKRSNKAIMDQADLFGLREPVRPRRMTQKSGLTSDDEDEDDDEDDEDDLHDDLDDLLDDFPEVLPTVKRATLPQDTPQQALFEDFMF
jgi:hypothetical protein